MILCIIWYFVCQFFTNFERIITFLQVKTSMFYDFEVNPSERHTEQQQNHPELTRNISDDENDEWSEENADTLKYIVINNKNVLLAVQNLISKIFFPSLSL